MAEKRINGGMGAMVGRLDGKAALVVGAGTAGGGWGNGKAAAVLFAREGAHVFAVDRDPAAAEETRCIIEGEGGVCAAHRADVTHSADAAAMAAACVDAFGRIDVLHNNVGGSDPGGPVEMDEATWDAAIDINLKSAFLTCKHVLPVMVAGGGGAIVHVSSVAGMRGYGRAMIAYQSSKAGLIQFSRGVALQYADKGIRSNCVVPGPLDTPLVRNRIGKGLSEAELERLIEARHRSVPMGRMGDAWDVAYAALFLASDEARFVTATELVVDGGFTASCG